MHLRFSAHLRHRRVTELDGESAFTEMSLGKRFCASPMRGEEGEDRVGNAKGGRYKNARRSRLVTSVRPICPTSLEKKRKEETRRKKGSRIYVRKERSKTAKVRWHLLYSVRPMIAFSHLENLFQNSYQFVHLVAT